jgi:quinol monooxygenase YgiN
MSTFFRIILAASAILMAVIGLAYAQSSPVYVVTYVDVMPNATNSGAALLQHYGDVSGNEKGNLRTIVLQEMARPNRFALIEMWKDKAASDAHDKASSSAELIEKLKAIGNARSIGVSATACTSIRKIARSSVMPSMSSRMWT